MLNLLLSKQIEDYKTEFVNSIFQDVQWDGDFWKVYKQTVVNKNFKWV